MLHKPSKPNGDQDDRDLSPFTAGARCDCSGEESGEAEYDARAAGAGVGTGLEEAALDRRPALGAWLRSVKGKCESNPFIRQGKGT